MPTSCTSCCFGNCLRKPETCPCSRPTMATRSGASWAKTQLVPTEMETRQDSRERATRIVSSKIRPSLAKLCLRGRLAGAAYPDAILLFQIDPLGLRAQVAAPVEDIDQRRRLRNVEVNLAKKGNPHVAAVLGLKFGCRVHRARLFELCNLIGSQENVGL